MQYTSRVSSLQFQMADREIELRDIINEEAIVDFLRIISRD